MAEEFALSGREVGSRQAVRLLDSSIIKKEAKGPRLLQAGPSLEKLPKPEKGFIILSK